MKQKPYHLLLLTALAFLLISFFILKDNNAIDIHLHDTYFVIAHTHVFWLLAILCLFVWILYVITNKILFSKALTWVHVIFTILAMIIFVSDFYFANIFSNIKPRRYYDFSSWVSFRHASEFVKAIGIALILFLSGQIIFVINFIAGIFKRK